MAESEARGLFASDIIIRSAIIQAFRDLRANPWLLSFIWSSLLADELTQKTYGRKEVDAAKSWFLKTEIPVLINLNLGDPKFPCISIHLVNSQETDNTLADVHYVPDEPYAQEWPALTSAFVPSGFSALTGVMTLPVGTVVELQAVGGVFPGMNVTDAQGSLHEIVDVRSENSICLQAGTNADFRSATIKSGSPPQNLRLKSVNCNESYLIGCHVQGEAVHLVYLHDILRFCLWRYRQTLLEGRGFEISSISSTDFSRDQSLPAEIAYSRYVTLSGKVRQVWPHDLAPAATGVAAHFTVEGSGTTPPPDKADELLWSGDLDGLGIK